MNPESHLQERRQWLCGAAGALSCLLWSRSRRSIADEPGAPHPPQRFKHSVC